MIDILFIHPSAIEQNYQHLSKDHVAIEVCVWAGMLTKSCLSKGYSAEILDCEAERASLDEAITVIEYLKPRITCIVVYGQQPSASS